MSALILKDLYIMKKYCRSVLLMVVIFWGTSIFADSGNLFWTFFPRDSRLGHTGDAAVI